MLSSIVLRLLPRNCAALSAPCLQCRLRPVLAGASFKSCRPCAECSMPSPLQVRLLPWTARTRSTPRASTAFTAPSKDPSRLYGKMFFPQVPRRDVSSCLLPHELNACPIPLPAACCSVRTFSAQSLKFQYECTVYGYWVYSHGCAPVGSGTDLGGCPRGGDCLSLSRARPRSFAYS